MSYDEYQQVFALSMASNLDAKCTGSQSALQASIETNLPPLISKIQPSWSLTWGPVVYQAPGDKGPSNTWYVANNPSMKFADGTTYNTYVVAIAGTAKDIYDWTEEDLDVGTVVDFDSWVRDGITNAPQKASPPFDGPYAAMGTVRTVFTLLTMPAPSTAHGNGQTLHQYLTMLPQANSSRIIFTGHSLGGALSPTMALGFLQAGQLSGLSVLAYPTAGPTPGNKEFASRFQKYFPKMPADGSTHRVWNCNIVNLSDIIPYAWNNFPIYLTIYGPLDKVCTKAVTWVVDDILVPLLKPANLPYHPIQNSPFDSSSPPPTPPWFPVGYWNDAVAQHIQEYFNQFDIPYSNPTCSCSGSDERTGDDVASFHPIIKYLAIAQTKFKANEGAEV